MAKERVVGGDHQVSVGGLVEMPAVAVTLGLHNADLLEFLQRPVTGLRVRKPLADRGAVAKRSLGRILDPVFLQPEFGEPEAGRIPPFHELGKVGAAAQVITDTTDHHHPDVVIDRRAAQQIGVTKPRRRRRCVEKLRTVERDRRDLGLWVLVVEDDLLGGGTFLVSHSMQQSACRPEYSTKDSRSALRAHRSR